MNITQETFDSYVKENIVELGKFRIFKKWRHFIV